MIQQLPTYYADFFTSYAIASESYNDLRPSFTDNTFANPEEVISADECYSRVKDFAEKLRNMIKRAFEAKPGTAHNYVALSRFYDFISRMEREGTRCCYSGTKWSICCEPIARIWKEWKDCGVPEVAPR